MSYRGRVKLSPFFLMNTVNKKHDSDEIHNHLLERRNRWFNNRKLLEGSSVANATPGRRKSIKSWRLFSYAINFFRILLRTLFLFKRGLRNSMHCHVRLQDHIFKDIPPNFNGLTILQVSDLHLQEDPALIERIIGLVRGLNVDLIAFTGDFTTKSVTVLSDDEIVKRIKKLINVVRPKVGTFGVLGNHDHAELAAKLEGCGVKMLINEAVDLVREGQSLRLIGTDDPHYFFTNESLAALKKASEKFTIAMVHSPELFDMASKLGVDFYLCGHTHGGQVCLPGGLPVLTHLNAGKRFFRGPWFINGMRGYTSSGVGTVALPVRFNVRGEVVLHFCRKA